MILLTIWPLFALICLGFGLARAGFPSREFWPAAERINYMVLFPALLFSSLATAPVRDAGMLRLGGAAVATLLVAALALMLARRVWPSPARRFGPALQGVVRFNTYLGFAVVTALAGPEGLSRAAVYLAIAVPLVNVLSILALTERGGGTGLRLLGAVLRNPLILACLGGIAMAFSGLGLPVGSDALLRLMAQASLPLGLLCVGAALQPATLRQDLRAVAATSVLRLLVMPALALGVAPLFGLSAAETMILVIFSALPVAPTAYVLTRQLGGDGPFMAAIITGQTFLAALTLPMLLSVLERI